MQPAAFIRLEALPLTANGKLDRGRLPGLQEWQRQGGDEYEAAQTPTQEVLAAIWCQLMGLERVSLHDNFFALGGHSLIATQVISRLRKLAKGRRPP